MHSLQYMGTLGLQGKRDSELRTEFICNMNCNLHERLQADLVHRIKLLVDPDICPVQTDLLRKHHKHVGVVILRLGVVDPAFSWEIIAMGISICM